MEEAMGAPGSLWGKTLKISIPEGDPTFGQVTDVETGTEVTSISGITFDLDMNRLNWRNRIKASLIIHRPGVMEEVPVEVVKEFSLIVQMATHPLHEEWDRFVRVQQEIMETIDKIGTIDDTQEEEQDKENKEEIC